MPIINAKITKDVGVAEDNSNHINIKHIATAKNDTTIIKPLFFIMADSKELS